MHKDGAPVSLSTTERRGDDFVGAYVACREQAVKKLAAVYEAHLAESPEPGNSDKVVRYHHGRHAEWLEARQQYLGAKVMQYVWELGRGDDAHALEEANGLLANAMAVVRGEKTAEQFKKEMPLHYRPIFRKAGEYLNAQDRLYQHMFAKKDKEYSRRAVTTYVFYVANAGIAGMSLGRNIPAKSTTERNLQAADMGLAHAVAAGTVYHATRYFHVPLDPRDFEAAVKVIGEVGEQMMLKEAQAQMAQAR